MHEIAAEHPVITIGRNNALESELNKNSNGIDRTLPFEVARLAANRARRLRSCQEYWKL